MDDEVAKEVQSYGAFSTFDFNPLNSLEIVIGFGNVSPRKFSFESKTFGRVAQDEQPFQKENFKVVNFLPDGKRVISGDYNQGVGYWPGLPNKPLIYKPNFIFLGVKPYDGGRRVLGYVWETLNVIEIQFECSSNNFSTSCECEKDKFWDMAEQSCQPCIRPVGNICICASAD